MGNPWFDHLSAFRKSHPNLSMKEAMRAAKKTYKKVVSAVKKTVKKSRKHRKSAKKGKKDKKSRKVRKSRKGRKGKKTKGGSNRSVFTPLDIDDHRLKVGKETGAATETRQAVDKAREAF